MAEWSVCSRDYRENIADKTARRYCSHEISVDNSIEARRSCETFDLHSTATDRKYPPFFLSSSPARDFHCARIAFAEINSRSHRWKLLARRGSAPADFSSSTMADAIDREKGRAVVDRRSCLPRGGGARRGRRPRMDVMNENGSLSTGGLRLFQEWPSCYRWRCSWTSSPRPCPRSPTQYPC